MFGCDFAGCGKTFPKPWRLKEHQCSAHTGERPYVCQQPGCGKAFLRPYHLKRHAISHLDSKPEHRCSVAGCGRVYSLLQNLRKHEKTHTTPLPYKCSVEACHSAFKKHSQLAVHLTRHSGDSKPFKCDWEGCQSAFVLPCELKKHAKRHKGYVCEQEGCEVTSSSWTGARRHAASHRSVCLECDQTFKRPHQLKLHVAAVHSESRSVLCCSWEGCSRTYTKLYNLQQHVNSFHKCLKPNLCMHPDCHAKFTTKQALRRHIETLHSGKPTKKRKAKRKRSLASRLSGFVGATAEQPQSSPGALTSADTTAGVGSSFAIDCR